MRRRRRRPVGHPPSHERWLVSYADFITLMFAFFTVLYASSTVDTKKLQSVVDSMHVVFDSGGAAAVPRSAAVPPPVLSPRRTGKPDRRQEIRASLARALASDIAAGQVSVDSDARGVVLSIRESGSFPTGSADLPPAAVALLNRIAGQLAPLSDQVRVEGHTDDVPIQTSKYASNWELSTARATRVVSFFVAAGLDPSRLSAAGYGEFRPRVPNDSAGNRARNRRIDLVILNAASAAEEPRAGAR